MRVVVTEARQGQSVIGKDSQVDPAAAPGMRLGLLWGSDDAPPEVPGTGKEASAGPDGFFPSVGGYRATLVEFDPSPSLTTTDGLHQADTVDVVWIISGELGCNLDSGETVWLVAGDLVVVTGANHQWLNRTDVVAKAGFVTLGARRRD